MSKRIISLMLVMLLCLGVLPVQSLAAAQTVTRVEWVQALVAACSMTVESDACPDNYFSDMSAKDDFYRDVIVAVEFGLIDTPVGLAFNPQEPATREFVAHTLNAALMFQLPEGTEYTYAEADTVTYPDDIQVSLNQGWFSLVEGAFLPQQAVTVGEKTAILASVAQILEESEVDPTHEDSYTFAEGVKAIEDTEDVYLTEDNQVVITGSSVELTGGDVFVVWIMGLPYAFRATAVSVDETVMTVTADPVELEEAVLNMDIESISEVDLAYFVPAEGLEAVYEFEDGTETTSRAYARSKSQKVKIAKIYVPLEMEFDNVTISGVASLSKMTLTYSIKDILSK